MHEVGLVGEPAAWTRTRWALPLGQPFEKQGVCPLHARQCRHPAIVVSQQLVDVLQVMAVPGTAVPMPMPVLVSTLTLGSIMGVRLGRGASMRGLRS